MIEKGDFISIAEPSGSGKTTILNMIGCIDTPTGGTVEIASELTGGLSDRKITSLRYWGIGFIFQTFNLLPVLNVYENVEFPLLLGKVGMNRQERHDWITSIIEAVGLTEWTRHRSHELTGGQRQRVAIARVLATKPQVITTAISAFLCILKNNTLRKRMTAVNKSIKEKIHSLFNAL